MFQTLWMIGEAADPYVPTPPRLGFREEKLMKKQINISSETLNARPRFETRSVTDQGITLWQLNAFMQNTGYRIVRGFGIVPVNSQFKPIENPWFDTTQLRIYSMKKREHVSLDWWTKEINKKLITGGRYGRKI